MYPCSFCSFSFLLIPSHSFSFLLIPSHSFCSNVLHISGGQFSSDSDTISLFAAQLALAVAAVHVANREKNVKMARFLKRYQNIHLTKSWNQWHQHLSNARRLKNLRKKGLAMMRNRLSSRAFLTWEHFWSQQKRQRLLVTRIISRLLNNLLHRGFQCWCQYNLRMQIAADAQDLYAQMQALKQHHQDEVISKAVRRIANRKLASAYYTWQSQYEQAKIRRVQIRRACARWNQRTLVRTFDALVTHAVERVRVRQLLLKVLGRVDNYATFRYVYIFFLKMMLFLLPIFVATLSFAFFFF